MAIAPNLAMPAEMQRVAFNNYLGAVVCGFFVLLVLAMCVYTHERYPAHAAEQHPERPALSRGACCARAIEHKYGKSGPRCC